MFDAASLMRIGSERAGVSGVPGAGGDDPGRQVVAAGVAVTAGAPALYRCP
ncbi:hypothetical protein ACWDWU_01350 [Streptomyces sp. NPDC003442]